MKIHRISKVSFFLVVIMSITILLCCISQVQAAQEGNYTYTITDGETQITKYTGAGGDITIPSTLGGLPVTSIGDYSFVDCRGLTSISIPQGVISIGFQAFAYCTGLTSISIPQGVTSIGYAAFDSCTGLTSILVDNNNSNYTSIDGVLFNKAVTTLIACPEGLTSVTIPEGVTSIDNYAFLGCTGLTNISIPQGVTSIGGSAFAGCTGLNSISIPKGLKSIGDYAFLGCTGLTSICIPQEVTAICHGAFENCTSLTSISVDVNNLNYTSIDGVLFNKEVTTLIVCPGGLTNISIPQGVTSVEDVAFAGCRGLTSINIPQGVTSIGNSAFDSCTGLASITISQGVTSIGNGAFYNCAGLTSIRFNSATTTIYDNEYTIPAETKIIGYDPSTAKTYATKYNRTFEVIINKSALITAITNAINLLSSKPIGTAIGNVSQSAHDAYNLAITTATAVKDNPAVTQAQVDAAVTALATATTAFNNSIIVPGAAIMFTMTAPSSAIENGAISVTVTAKDSLGNIATGYCGKVHFTSTNSLAGLPADYTFTTADNGSHTFSVTFGAVGATSITVTDLSNRRLKPATSKLTVKPVVVTSLAITAPSTAIPNSPISVTVVAKFASGEIVTGYRGKVHFTSTDGLAVLPTDYTFTSADNGTHTFSITMKTLGAKTVTVADAVSGTLKASSQITVSSIASMFEIQAPSLTAVNGPMSITITAKDASGNIATGYRGKIHFTSTDKLAVLPADYTLTSSDKGVHTFKVTIKTIGEMSVTVTDMVNSTLNGTKSFSVYFKIPALPNESIDKQLTPIPSLKENNKK